MILYKIHKIFYWQEPRKNINKKATNRKYEGPAKIKYHKFYSDKIQIN